MTDCKLVPVAWVTADTVDGQAVNGKPRRIWWENNEGVGIPIYAAPQTAPDVADVNMLVEALELALEYWRHRQQRYKNRKPRWVADAESALSAHRKEDSK